MPRLSIRRALIALGLAFLAIVVAGILYDFVKDRRDMRVHAAAITNGDPSRGEAMFIQYGCGSRSTESPFAR